MKHERLSFADIVARMREKRRLAAHQARWLLLQAAIAWEQNPSPNEIASLAKAVLAYKELRIHI
jgi:hypothetical protein